jgi:hypothetical protein
MKKPQIRTNKAFAPFILLFAALAVIGVRENRRALINQRLIDAVESADTNAALAALALCADPKVHRSGELPQANTLLRLWQTLRGGGGHSIPVLYRALSGQETPGPNGKSRTSNIELAMTLLERGADPNEGDGNHTPLMIAVAGDNMPLVRLLLEKGANVQARDKDGQTPLFYAGDSVEATALLLEKGANPNDTDKELRTPLMSARTLEVAKLLVNKGATINAKDIHKLGALDRILGENWRANDLVPYLKQHGAVITP